MTVQREHPHGNSWESWSFNAETFERNRVECLETAALMRREGNEEGARRFDAHAARWKRYRDAEQRRHEMQILNRRAHRRS